MTANLGQPVAIAEIDRELRKLWEADDAATNASLMNFAIYSETASKLETNSAAIQKLTRENAFRAILIGMDRHAPEMSIEAWITAHCHLSDGAKSVCCEQLSFLLRGRAVGRLRNTVFAHLNSDLPLVFWWQGELSELFEERLYRLMDRLFIDSSEWQDVNAGFRKVAEAVENSRCQIGVQDLAWTRTYHFRLGIAGLFDDSAAEAMLPTIHKVTIEAQSQHWTSVWMLVAWLGTQAGWALRGKSAGGFEFQNSTGQPIEVAIIPKEDGPPLGRVSIENADTVLAVTRREGKGHLELSLRAPHHELDQLTPADSDGQVDLVAEQLSRGGKSSLFLRIWPLFFEMLGIEQPGSCSQ